MKQYDVELDEFDNLKIVELTNGDWCKSKDVAELEAINSELVLAARAVIERWDSPTWKWDVHTGVFIDALRKAVCKSEEAFQ